MRKTAGSRTIAAGQRHALPLATRQLAREPVKQVVELDHRGGPSHAVVMLSLRNLPDLQGKQMFS
jgi:hypothetical protein